MIGYNQTVKIRMKNGNKVEADTYDVTANPFRRYCRDNNFAMACYQNWNNSNIGGIYKDLSKQFENLMF